MSTGAADGTANLAPYSYSPHRRDAAADVVVLGERPRRTDTADLAGATNATSATLVPDGSEFERAGVTPAEAHAVDAPRVAESPVGFGRVTTGWG